MNITILTDKSSWMNYYNVILAERLLSLGHIVNLVSSKEDIHNGDVAFFLSCFEVIASEKLKMNKNNVVVHASLLPQGKGWSPASWQIIAGKNKIPITLFEANDKIDGGVIYQVDEVSLVGHELLDEWQRILGLKIVEMCYKFIENYDNLKPKQQQGEESFYRRRKPCDSELDVNKTIEQQFDLLRIVNNENYPAFFYYKGHKYILQIFKEK